MGEQSVDYYKCNINLVFFKWTNSNKVNVRNLKTHLFFFLFFLLPAAASGVEINPQKKEQKQKEQEQEKNT